MSYSDTVSIPMPRIVTTFHRAVACDVIDIEAADCCGRSFTVDRLTITVDGLACAECLERARIDGMGE